MPVQPRVFEKRILLVDDDATARESIKLLLMIDRHVVTEADSSQEALTRFDPARFDLAIIDYFMPHMQGHELAAKLRLLAPSLPIVMATAYAEKLVDLGLPVDAVLPKPFGIDELRETVARVLS